MATGLIGYIRIVTASLALAVGFTFTATAIDVPPKPVNIPIVDQTRTLSDEQMTNLANKIANERTETGNQIAILIVNTLDNQPIENFSLDVAREWGIGDASRDNGILLLIAKGDRKLRIEVGYGLEGALPDIKSGQIIRERITPEFSEERYYQGIDKGLDSIITAIHGEADPNLSETSTSGGIKGISWELLFGAILFVPMWLSSILARTKSWWAGGVIGAAIGISLGFIFGFLFVGIIGIAAFSIIGLLFDRAVSRNFQDNIKNGDAPSWWAGGTTLGGNGDSGGFGGFGGGGFGGGGASGDW